MKTKLNIFWYSPLRMNQGDFENFGDILSKYLVEKISGKKIKWRSHLGINKLFFWRKNFLVSGSILQYADRNSTIWGAGIMQADDVIPNGNYLAIRGKYTRKRMKELSLPDCKIMGDPGLLLPKYFPQIKTQQYKLGIIPHYMDYSYIVGKYSKNKDVIIIDLRSDFYDVLAKINSCKFTLSSSLHGIIVSQAYGIPSLRIASHHKLAGDGVKYLDYFSSVDITPYQPYQLQEIIVNYSNPKYTKIRSINKNLGEIQSDLLSVCPFLPINKS